MEASHGRDSGHRRDALSAGTGSRGVQTLAARAHARQRPAHSRAHARPGQLAASRCACEWGDDEGITSHKAHKARVFERLPQDPRGDRCLRARLHRHVGRRPVRELQGRHHPAVLRARVRAVRFQAVRAPARPAQHLGRAGRQGLHASRTPQGRALSRASGCWKKASTCPTPTSRCTRTASGTPSPTRCSTSISTARVSTRRSCRSR